MEAPFTRGFVQMSKIQKKDHARIAATNRRMRAHEAKFPTAEERQRQTAVVQEVVNEVVDNLVAYNRLEQAIKAQQAIKARAARNLGNGVTVRKAARTNG